MSYIIKYGEGNYFQSMAPIGPVFGATKKEACMFDSETDAMRLMSSHYGFTTAVIEEVVA